MKQLATNIVELAAIVMILISIAVSMAALSQWAQGIDQASTPAGMASPTRSGALMTGGR